MALPPGARLGSYEIVSPLGAGGMGEVYRARDGRLKRDVAVKILPDAFARDPDRLARFEREAQVLASLSHPNIAIVHGLESDRGLHALVMELVEGETLADRLERGALPPDEALAIAAGVARGLEAAHDRGIIHRDVKPANIRLMADGAVKVLDFGLAKSLRGDAGGDPGSDAAAATVAGNVTDAGVILGTAAYMSPEQARGRRVDHQTDIWAFGCVLFEMLTGGPAFVGDSATDILARVIEREPEWRRLPSSLPPNVRRVLHRCLEKDASRRYHHIADARLDLTDVVDTVAAPPGPSRGRGFALAGWALAAASTVAALAAWALRPAAGAEDVPDVMHLDLPIPEGVESVTALTSSFAVAPDGGAVARIGVKGGVRRVFLSRLDRAGITEIAASGGANAVRFSPDGESIAFLTGGGSLTTYSLRDGVTRAVAGSTDITSGFAWCDEGLVYRKGSALWTVSPKGDGLRELTASETAGKEVAHVTPACLPGGQVAFTVISSNPASQRIDVVSMTGADRAMLLENAGKPVWVPGHLLFSRDDAVMAAPFDAAARKVTGAARVMLPAGTVVRSNSGTLEFEVSADGTLAYATGRSNARRLVLVGREGSALLADAPVAGFSNPRFAPEGRRLSVEEDGLSIALLDLARGTRSTLGGTGFGTGYTVWSSSGARLVFRRVQQVMWMDVDGGGGTGVVPGTTGADYPAGPGADPDTFLMVRIDAETGGDVYLASISGAFQPRALIKTPTYEGGPQFSPEHRWLLYQSNESGQPEIYLRPYPALTPTYPVSAGGGVQARFARTGKEIYFRSGGRMMAVSADLSGNVPVLGKPAALFEDVYNFGTGISVPNYDVAADGRFVMTRSELDSGRLHVVRNWTVELRQLLIADPR